MCVFVCVCVCVCVGGAPYGHHFVCKSFWSGHGPNFSEAVRWEWEGQADMVRENIIKIHFIKCKFGCLPPHGRQPNSRPVCLHMPSPSCCHALSPETLANDKCLCALRFARSGCFPEVVTKGAATRGPFLFGESVCEDDFTYLLIVEESYTLSTI